MAEVCGLGRNVMHYDLQQDACTGNWWVIKQDAEGFRQIMYTLSHTLSYTEAKEHFEMLVQMEKHNDT
jgi:hypothetical protein